ncbi:MAG TPA: hypothetical protein VF158_04170 [Longimicrobiales bacterium]
MNRDRHLFAVLGLVTVVQALAFYDHAAVALALLFAIGIGLWLRRWTAALYALGSFAVAMLLSAGVGWTRGVRVWDPLLGAALAFLGGLIGGGIFDVLRRERAEEEAVRRIAADGGGL